MARLLHDESLLIARHWYSKGSSAATYWTLIGPRFSGERVKTVATPEEVELGKRLESIFSPHAVSQMQEFFKKQPDQTQARFVHYTSAEAALRIIGSKRIWMRNVTCMSDYSEVQHGFRILNNIFSEPSKRKIFDEALDACAPGAAAEAIKLFNSWWADISLNTYITSISEHDEKEDRHGRLSMWRAFGGNVARVAIVFKVSSSLLNAGVFNLIVSPVAYLTEEEVQRQFHQVVANVQDNREFLKSVGSPQVVQQVFNMLVAGVTCLKHEGFKEEREWRLVYAPRRWPSPLIESSTEVLAGIPQIVYKVPLDAAVSGVPKYLDLSHIFDRLIIGPSQYPWPMAEAFVTALTNAGVAEAEKRWISSGIPIRT